MRLSISGSLLLLSLALGCASSSAKPGDNPAPAEAIPAPAQNGDHPRARIENNSSLDMDIYVPPIGTRADRVRAGQPVRHLRLPPAIVAGSAAVRFEARPVRGSGRPVGSEIFPINDGSDITWTIPAQ